MKYLFFIFCFLGMFLGNVFVHGTEMHWLELVRQRLELEQGMNSPEGFISRNCPGGLKKGMECPLEEKRKALDDAVEFYHESFDEFYHDVLATIDPCGDWCDLKDYLIVSKGKLDREYSLIKRNYGQSSIRVELAENNTVSYQKAVSKYYDEVLEVFRYITIKGPDKQMELFRKAVVERKHEKLQKKRSDAEDVFKENVNGE